MSKKKKYLSEEEKKAAMSEYYKQYYIDNKEKILSRTKQYKIDNKDKVAKHSKTHYEKYKERDKEKNNNRNKEFYNTLRGRCWHISHAYQQKDTKRFGTSEYTVTTEQMQEMIETHPCCFYCGCEDISQLGLDRIDNNKPHTVDNCVVCCGKCNIERNTMPFEEFKKLKCIV